MARMFGVPRSPLPRLGNSVSEPLPGLGQTSTEEPPDEYPGLIGPRPATFTKDQRAKTLASLLKNETNYLQTDDRERKPFQIDRFAYDPKEGKGGKVLGGDSLYGESMWTGGGQTRDESRRERESMARQVAAAQEREQGIMADQARELARQKEIAEQAYRADEAARKQAFYEKYGFEASPQAIAEIVKFQSKAGIQEGVAIDLAKADEEETQALEEARAAGLLTPAKETEITEKFKTKRNNRLQMLRYIMDAAANRYEGAPDYSGTTGQ